MTRDEKIRALAEACFTTEHGVGRELKDARQEAIDQYLKEARQTLETLEKRGLSLFETSAGIHYLD